MPATPLCRTAWYAGVLLSAACAVPGRQFELRDRPLDCAQANRYAYFALRSMRFTLTALEPAKPGHPGRMRGTRRTGSGTETASVTITCHPNGTADVVATQDRTLVTPVEFKRGFYMSFSGVVSEEEGAAAAAQAEAARSLEEKQRKGLQVSIRPVPGVGSKLDFDVDIAAGGVLPVLVTINNVTARAYTMTPNDLVLIRDDGARVPPMPVQAAAERVANAPVQRAAGRDLAAVAAELQGRLLTVRAVAAEQRASGYLYYPAGEYIKARVVVEETASGETEGFVVEF